MYLLASKLEGMPVISLQTGEAVAWLTQPIIDIRTLEVVAFRCEASGHKGFLILIPRDIRQLASDCIIVDSEEELSEPEDIIRLKAVIETNFTPREKPVFTESERKIGTVEDYTINLESNRVQKLFAYQSFWRSWVGASLAIDRSQIVDVTPQRIIVRDATTKSPILPTEPIPEIRS